MQPPSGPEPSSGNSSEASPATVLTAYLEKSPIIQAVIRDLVNILNDKSLLPEKRQWAERALQSTLFHHRPQVQRTISTEAWLQPPGCREVRQRLEAEHMEFTANLARLLKQKGISEAELAKRAGLEQPAISMMLSRRFRPHSRTVKKLAEALGVELSELWPG